MFLTIVDWVGVRTGTRVSIFRLEHGITLSFCRICGNQSSHYRRQRAGLSVVATWPIKFDNTVTVCSVHAILHLPTTTRRFVGQAVCDSIGRSQHVLFM